MEQHTSSVKGFADSKAEGLTDKLLHHPPVLRGDQEVVGQRLPMDAHGLPRAEFLINFRNFRHEKGTIQVKVGERKTRRGYKDSRLLKTHCYVQHSFSLKTHSQDSFT